jgi:hypothetical protein
MVNLFHSAVTQTHPDEPHFTACRKLSFSRRAHLVSIVVSSANHEQRGLLAKARTNAAAV